MEMYEWQKKIIECEGDLTIRGGRQVGKSEAVAERIVYLSKKYAPCRILITSPSERQENYLYFKVRRILGDRHKYKKKPTLGLLLPAWGGEIRKIPIGRTGMYVEGMSSVDFLFVDEAMFMGKIVWDAILPMLAEPKSRKLGWITLLSNTRGRPEGVFYESFKEDSGFTKIWISAEDCPHIPKDFLAKEKKRLSENMYRMIWCGEFVESEFWYFDKILLEQAMNIKSWNLHENLNYKNKYFLGIDPARFGKCEAGFAVAELVGDKINIIHAEAIKKSSMPELMQITMRLDSMFKFNKIFIDGGGIGGGLVDFLKEKLKYKIVDLNNAAKSKEGKRIFKEDLYENALRLLETGRLAMIRNEELLFSLKNVIYEKEEFSGKKSDLAEAMIRACWGAKEGGSIPRII